MLQWRCAVVAQLVEQLIRNEQVAGSTPVNGSTRKPAAFCGGFSSERDWVSSIWFVIRPARSATARIITLSQRLHFMLKSPILAVFLVRSSRRRASLEETTNLGDFSDEMFSSQ